MRIGRAQNSRFGSTMHARGVSSVWESAGEAAQRGDLTDRLASRQERKSHAALGGSVG